MSKLPTPVKPYTKYVSSPSILVEKNGFRGGSHTKPKAYVGHVVNERRVAGPYNQPACYNNWDIIIKTDAPWARMESKLHSKLQDILGERAEIGTTLAEYSSAVQMVSSAVTRLSSAALAIKKGQFRKFLGALNAKPLPQHRHWVRSSPKIASKLWIEYWFGWSPTINDIQTAGRILDSDPPVGSLPFLLSTGCEWAASAKPSSFSPGYAIVAKSFVKAGGNYQLVNPNLALAQSLGILNPLTIVVNVTAWSWLVGWFVNLNQWVDSLTAFAGYKFTDVYTTRFTTFEGSKHWYFGPTNFARYNVRGMYTTRELRLPVVKLHCKKFNLSLTRAATAVSLLTLRLKSL